MKKIITVMLTMLVMLTMGQTMPARAFDRIEEINTYQDVCALSMADNVRIDQDLEEHPNKHLRILEERRRVQADYWEGKTGVFMTSVYGKYRFDLGCFEIRERICIAYNGRITLSDEFDSYVYN